MNPPLERQLLGIIVGGSVDRGFQVRLNPDVPLEGINVGSQIVVQGTDLVYFCIVTDVSLEAVDSRYRSISPSTLNPFITEVAAGTVIYGTLQVSPMLTLPASGKGQIQPARSLPPPFSQVLVASDSDFEEVFGKESNTHFFIGTPLHRETKICLDIEKLMRRSTGVFGKSGTGKTFLTRLLLMGILKSNLASTLVFDMQNEYGWSGTSEAGAGTVKGLKQLFPSQVSIFSMDPENSKLRGAKTDFTVTIGLDEIEPEDIKVLQELLNLSDVAADAAYTVEAHYGQRVWIHTLLNLPSEGFSELARSLNINEAALSALQRRLRRLERFDFVVKEADKTPKGGTVRSILDYLERGFHVVLEFGGYQDNRTAYILVTNLLTRRIYNEYRARTEAAMGNRGNEPRPLVITIEEAHRFLTPQLASQTIFGTIAREMRKYHVNLLVVDQRPGRIDSEVMSQLGTKITCSLDDGKDVDSILSGVSGRRDLRSVIETLSDNREALILGHAIPMPTVIRTREYGSNDSYKSLGQSPPTLNGQILVGDDTGKPNTREFDLLFGSSSD